MPITYSHNINPLVGGLAGWVAGFGEARGKSAPIVADQVQTAMGVNAAMQRQTSDIISGAAAQQTDFNNRVRLQNQAHLNALSRLGTEEQIGYRQAFYKAHGVNPDQAHQQYVQYVGQEMDAIGLAPGPTIERANYSPTISEADFNNQIAMKYAAAQHGMAVPPGMEEYSPYEDKIKELSNFVQAARTNPGAFNLSPDEAFRLDDGAIVQAHRQLAAMQAIPKQLRPKNPQAMSLQEDIQRGGVAQLPNGTWVTKQTDARGGSRWAKLDDAAPATGGNKIIESLTTGQPVVMPDGTMVPPNEYVNRAYGKAGYDIVSWKADPKKGITDIKYEKHKLTRDEALDGYDKRRKEAFATTGVDIGPPPAELTDDFKWGQSQGKIKELAPGYYAVEDEKGQWRELGKPILAAKEKAESARQQYIKDAWAEYHRLGQQFSSLLEGETGSKYDTSHEFVRGKVWAAMDPKKKEVIWAMQNGEEPVTPFDGNGDSQQRPASRPESQPAGNDMARAREAAAKLDAALQSPTLSPDQKRAVQMQREKIRAQFGV